MYTQLIHHCTAENTPIKKQSKIKIKSSCCAGVREFNKILSARKPQFDGGDDRLIIQKNQCSSRCGCYGQGNQMAFQT